MNTKKNSAKLIIIVAISFILGLTASFLVILLTDKTIPADTSVTVLDSGIVNSSSNDIYGEIISADLDGEYPYIEVEWFNNSGTGYTAGEEFYIYKTEKDKLTDCRKNPDEYAWNEIAYVFSSYGSFKTKYYIGDMELDKNETYLLETEIFPVYSDSLTLTLWLEFRTGELTDETIPITNSGSVYFEY